MSDGYGRWLRSLTAAISLLVFAKTVGCRRAAPPLERPPNILLVTIDTLRADRVGAGITPAIDRLAASGVRFTSARSAVPLTLPSHTTIHTGLLPPAHGVRENGIDALADTHATIARLLKGAGYDTAAFVGAFVLDHRFGLAQGFDIYDDQILRDPDAADRLEAERPASAVIERALAWLDANRQSAIRNPQSAVRNPQSAFFLWVHLYDPHAPYNPPSEFRARTTTPYDGEIAYADSQLARLLDRLSARGLMERTVVAVAGDHGEGLGEHGERTHGMLVYDSTLRVPLIIAAPGHAAATRDEAVSLADVAPTILRAAGLTPPDAMKGRDLLGSVRLQRDLYSETEYPRVAGWSPLQALTDGRWMTIRGSTTTEVYDLRADPREGHDVAAAQAARAAAMASRAGAIHASAAASTSRAISPEAQDRLRSLGYVAGAVPAGSASGAPNPATRIAMWNEFEDAISALTARRADALTMLRRLASTNADSPVMQATYGRALKEAGQADAALAVYRQAARRWPTDATLFHDLAVTARDAANRARGPGAKALHDEASRADQAAVTLEPRSAAAHNGLGLLAIDNDRATDAVKAFERATAIDSNNASYWANLGNARRAAGDRAGAEQAYRRALEVDARMADAANGLGVLLVEANRPADAAAWFDRAIAAAPDLAEARLNLGIALQQSGQTMRAAEAYRGVLGARGDHPREKAAAAKLLASLRGAR